MNKETLQEILLNMRPIKRMYDFVVSNRLLSKVCCLLLIGMISVGVTVVAVGITVGLKVNYAGEFIATVKDTAVFEDAKEIAARNIDSTNAEKAIKTPSFKRTLTVSNRLSTATKLADKIIENTNDIVKATAVKVDGKQIAFGSSADVKYALNAALTRFEVAGAENSSAFISEVKTEEGYFLKSEISSKEDLKTALESIGVKTVSVITTDTEIAYKKTTVEDDNQLIGYKKVKTAGVKGLSRKVETVETLNGLEASRTEISNEVVKTPVTQVTVVGTAKTNASPAQRSEERSAGFICPLKRGSFTITSYMGDGRGHKGMDLAAKKGTPIYAAKDGTVIASGYNGNYGYTVDIDHGDGFKTRYAHASTLCVRKGQTVSQGEVIAYVGNSGRSTGNHLHFEVIKNGKTVNPVSYIGLD